jgi:FkbM family methyltransferase
MKGLQDNSMVRSISWRLGRKLYCWARRELSKKPSLNGEYWLLEQIIINTCISKPVFIDIGAYRGEWSSYAETLLAKRGPNSSGNIYAFEPATDSYAFLSERFKSSKFITCEKLALSDKSCKKNFYTYGKLAGINSLSKTVDAINIEQIYAEQLDDFLARRKIDQVVFVKSDAEGHDLNIILGSIAMFEQGRVEVWQFEYNHRWLSERFQLKDVFNFIVDKPYRLGKLYGDGIEIYDNWHPELERYFEANYVLIRRGSQFERLCKNIRFDCNNVLTQKV